MATVYISPTGSGDKSGSSPENAKPVGALDSAVQMAGAGGTVCLLADKGAYNVTKTITVSHGGTEGAPVKIIGVNSAGVPTDVTINGTRDSTWQAGDANGNEIFRLQRCRDGI
jgi:serralysin